MAQQPKHGDGSFNLLYKIADNTYDISQVGGGATGATGATGASVTGATGATGTAGINGSTGATGTQGDVGATGLTGATGIGYVLTSNDSIAIGTGVKIFNVSRQPENIAFNVGNRVRISNTSTNWMEGNITSFISSSAFTINATLTQGSGTYSTWNIDIAGVQGSTGATGIGTTGATGLVGATGLTGQSATFYNYQADTTQTTGVPTTGHLFWNNASQVASTSVTLSHIDALGNDIDVFFPLFKTGDTFIIQDQSDSNNFQTWEINATPTITLNSYISIPATLVTSGGTGTTGFANNRQLIFAIVTSGLTGATGLEGATGIQGPTPWELPAAEYNNGVSYNLGAAVTYLGGYYYRTGNPLNPGFAPTPGSISASWTPVADGGATGVSGDVGATGIQGEVGATGLEGATGITGDTGATGLTGATGIEGGTGATGVQGEVGSTGATGVAGIDGATGATGTGATGATGVMGATGTAGVNGATGATGPAANTSTFVQKTGDTMTGKLNLPASTASLAPLNLGNGTAPTSPLPGDLFFDGNLRYRDNASTTRSVAAINKVNVFTDYQTITTTNSTNPALLVTQNGNGGGVKIVNTIGSGESLRIEDDSPETTPFVVSATGRVGIGVNPDATVAISVDTTGVKFGDGTIQTTAATGSGTVTSVTGTSPIASSGGATPAISIANAAADGATKGAAAFNSSDFNATAGVVSIDYTTGQAASASAKGFLTSADWTTFNSKGVGTVTSVSATAPLTSTGGATPVISTSMASQKLLGRGALGVGTAEEISIGTGLSLNIGTLSNVGVLSDTTAAQGGTQLLNMVQITQAVYNGILTPTANTLYIIVG